MREAHYDSAMPIAPARGTSALARAWPLMLLALQPLAATSSAAPQPSAQLPMAPVESIFRIEKSENRNQVHYAVHVDANCKPIGPRPIYGYWRDLERGPTAVSPLLDHEQRAYGLNEPRSIRIGDAASEIGISLRAFPERQLTVQVFRSGDRCFARTVTRIRNQPALLQSIYIDIGFLFSVNYASVRGVRVQDSKPIQEKVDD